MRKPSYQPLAAADRPRAPERTTPGQPAIGHTLRIAQEQMCLARTARTLLKVNQKDGFDCPGCAWPEGDKR
ncbi:hypothetical protein, partial [Streptomyces sp. SP18ES09]|uniref:hypothetical protein n=1 Tax=Streptomyces sp. SP18ES09 TaxID=3002532 RepID=UPI003FCE2033